MFSVVDVYNRYTILQSLNNCWESAQNVSHVVFIITVITRVALQGTIERND